MVGYGLARAGNTAVASTGATQEKRTQTAVTPTHKTREHRADDRRRSHVHATDRPARQPDPHVPGGPDSRRFPAGAARGFSVAGLAAGARRLDNHHRAWY